jgi:bacteriocin-like protein
MDNKNLMIQANDLVTSIPGQDLSAEMIELSDEALSQIYGGQSYWDVESDLPKPEIRCIFFDPDSLIPGNSPYNDKPLLPPKFL